MSIVRIFCPNLAPLCIKMAQSATLEIVAPCCSTLASAFSAVMQRRADQQRSRHLAFSSALCLRQLVEPLSFSTAAGLLQDSEGSLVGWQAA